MSPRNFTDTERKAAERLSRLWPTRKKHLGLTQEKVALACGWSGQSAFEQYLSARVPLNIEAVLKISAALDAHPTEIMPEIAPLLPKESEVFSDEARCVASIIDSLSPDERQRAVNVVMALAGRLGASRPPADQSLQHADIIGRVVHVSGEV